MTDYQTLEVNLPVIVLVGPTAIGKTALSFEIVREFDCEIISMDSMQVYRHMDIGTAKPTAEEQRFVRHHLIDIVEPDVLIISTATYPLAMTGEQLRIFKYLKFYRLIYYKQ